MFKYYNLVFFFFLLTYGFNTIMKKFAPIPREKKNPRSSTAGDIEVSVINNTTGLRGA